MTLAVLAERNKIYSCCTVNWYILQMGNNKMSKACEAQAKVRENLNILFTQVLQKLGKTVETKDEYFEVCLQNLNKQQVHNRVDPVYCYVM